MGEIQRIQDLKRLAKEFLDVLFDVMEPHHYDVTRCVIVMFSWLGVISQGEVTGYFEFLKDKKEVWDEESKVG